MKVMGKLKCDEKLKLQLQKQKGEKQAKDLLRKKELEERKDQRKDERMKKIKIGHSLVQVVASIAFLYR
ncbi:hypothetical protein COLO4_13473 [Corchorus olitorius]|uniref:Uncharacterized protein n=1 Tax=Corchorus olitorius TaxID=93759 RepID=A0A1R3JWD2_9ROSI|nr:hypothetical protein COLO4_13473 [Corchorus olitorius]